MQVYSHWNVSFLIMLAGCLTFFAKTDVCAEKFLLVHLISVSGRQTLSIDFPVKYQTFVHCTYTFKTVSFVEKSDQTFQATLYIHSINIFLS